MQRLAPNWLLPPLSAIFLPFNKNSYPFNFVTDPIAIVCSPPTRLEKFRLSSKKKPMTRTLSCQVSWWFREKMLWPTFEQCSTTVSGHSSAARAASTTNKYASHFALRCTLNNASMRWHFTRYEPASTYRHVFGQSTHEIYVTCANSDDVCIKRWRFIEYNVPSCNLELKKLDEQSRPTHY